MLNELIRNLRPADFRTSHAVFRLPSPGHARDTLLITCSDLAINPFALIPTKPQHLYVLQNAGNLVALPPPECHGQTDIEAAVALHQISDIVVCGHSQCGVMETMLAASDVGLPRSLSRGLRSAQKTMRIVAACCGGLTGKGLSSEAARINILVQLANLRAIPSIVSQLDTGTIHLHGWFYSCGKISAYDPNQAEFISLSQ